MYNQTHPCPPGHLPLLVRRLQEHAEHPQLAAGQVRAGVRPARDAGGAQRPLPAVREVRRAGGVHRLPGARRAAHAVHEAVLRTHLQGLYTATWLGNRNIKDKLVASRGFLPMKDCRCVIEYIQ